MNVWFPVCLLMLTACGSPKRNAELPFIDAALPDAMSPDAPPPEVGSVQVTVNLPQNTLATVIFHNPDGSVAQRQDDVNMNGGSASYEDFTEGGLISLVYEVTSGSVLRTVMTVADVQVDQHVHIGSPAPPNDFETVSATLPGVYSGADSYALALGCAAASTVADPSTAQPLSVRNNCLERDTMHGLAIAREGPNDLAFAAKHDVPWIAGQANSMDLSAETWSPARQVSLTFSNAPPDSQYDVSAVVGVLGNTRIYKAKLNGPEVTLPSAETIDAVRVEAYLVDFTNLEYSTWSFARKEPSSIGPSYNLDFGNRMPTFSNLSYDDVSDPEKPRLSWTDANTAAAYFYCYQQWTSAEPALITWISVGPPSMTDCVMPDLPVDLDRFRDFETRSSYSVSAVETTLIDDYAAYISSGAFVPASDLIQKETATIEVVERWGE